METELTRDMSALTIDASLWQDDANDENADREALNTFLEKVSDGRRSPVRSVARTSWGELSQKQQTYYTRKAREIIGECMSVLAPGQENMLWDAVMSSYCPAQAGQWESFVCAYNDAATWQTKRQILSLVVDELSKEELLKLFPGLNVWRIDQARLRKMNGPGQPVPTSHLTRARLDQAKVDHFVDFISRPIFLQDVAFGTKTLKLSSGDTLKIPAVIRTAIPTRIITLYKAHCETTGCEPLSDRSIIVQNNGSLLCFSPKVFARFG